MSLSHCTKKEIPPTSQPTDVDGRRGFAA